MQQTYAAPVELYAGFWRRFAAIIIDGLVVGIPLDIILAPIGGGITESSQNAGHGLIRLVVFWLYFALLESSSYQATVGKMALGIKVTDLEGNRISFGRATGRYFAKIISTIICFIGYILAAFTERKQALHDMIASTLVVRKEVAFSPATGGYAGAYGPPPPPPSAPVSPYPAPPPPPPMPVAQAPPPAEAPPAEPPAQNPPAEGPPESNPPTA